VFCPSGVYPAPTRKKPAAIPMRLPMWMRVLREVGFILG
jgi:hypothetical protein